MLVFDVFDMKHVRNLERDAHRERHVSPNVRFRGADMKHVHVDSLAGELVCEDLREDGRGMHRVDWHPHAAVLLGEVEFLLEVG